MDNFLNIAVAGVPMVLVVVGLVEYVKAWGVSGKWLLATSSLIGLILGGLFMFANSPPPADMASHEVFVYWFGLVVYGIVVGLVASGLYSAVKSVIASGMVKFGDKQ